MHTNTSVVAFQNVKTCLLINLFLASSKGIKNSYYTITMSKNVSNQLIKHADDEHITT